MAASLQEAVRAGSLSVKQAAASLASYLRQRQQQAAAAAGSASSSPGHGCRQPSSVGSSGALGGTALSPFALSDAEVRQRNQAGRAEWCKLLEATRVGDVLQPLMLPSPLLSRCAADVLPQLADRPQPEPLGDQLHQQPTGGQACCRRSLAGTLFACLLKPVQPVECHAADGSHSGFNHAAWLALLLSAATSPGAAWWQQLRLMAAAGGARLSRA